MPDAISPKPELARYGVWTSWTIDPELTVQIEKLGYGAVWLGGAPTPLTADLAMVEPILERTKTLQVATSILNVWAAPATEVANSYHRIENAYPGRFLLGVGAGHPEHTTEYKKPYDALVEYLDELQAAEVPQDRLIIAALGPKVLKLSAERSAGAHPSLTTPEHTARARELIGTSAYLAPEQKVVLSEDAEAARELVRATLSEYLGLRNYVSNWKRLGYTDFDVAKPGSDKLIDAVVAHGNVDAIAARLSAHLEAGANHVAITVLGGWDPLIPTLTALGVPLGLTTTA